MLLWLLMRLVRSGRVVLGLEPGGLDEVCRRNLTSDVPRGLRSYRTGSLKLDFPVMDMSVRDFATHLLSCEFSSHTQEKLIKMLQS